MVIRGDARRCAVVHGAGQPAWPERARGGGSRLRAGGPRCFGSGSRTVATRGAPRLPAPPTHALLLRLGLEFRRPRGLGAGCAGRLPEENDSNRPVTDQLRGARPAPRSIPRTCSPLPPSSPESPQSFWGRGDASITARPPLTGQHWPPWVRGPRGVRKRTPRALRQRQTPAGARWGVPVDELRLELNRPLSTTHNFCRLVGISALQTQHLFFSSCPLPWRWCSYLAIFGVYYNADEHNKNHSRKTAK